MANETKTMAMFCDFENVALGVRDAKYDKFDIKKVLERLLLKGSIVVKKAYCDWERYKSFKAPMHEASFELIEIPHVRQSGKNSADIRMVVDALDLCYMKSHVDTFVLITGDSDFSPLVSKLRENNKTVIGVGVKKSTSDLLIANCDEFIYYDDLVREKPSRSRQVENGRRKPVPAKPTQTALQLAPTPAPEASETPVVEPIVDAPIDTAVDAPVEATAGEKPKKPAARSRRKPSAKAAKAEAAAIAAAAEVAAESANTEAAEDIEAAASADNADADADHPAKSEDEKRQEAIDLVMETIEALATDRGAEDKIWGSMVKQALKRRRPGFSEAYYGFSSFSRLLSEAEARKLIELDHDEKSGGVIIKSFVAD